jgi:hypothetical protein
LRDSIEHTVKSDCEAEIGSNLDIAVYQELGTGTIPLRLPPGRRRGAQEEVAEAMGLSSSKRSFRSTPTELHSA